MARPKKKAASLPAPPPLTPSTTKQFDKDAKTFVKRGKDLTKLQEVAATQCARRPLARSHKDPALKGDWVGCRDCHVEPDWVLIHEVVGDKLNLLRMGTHSDLFD